MRRRSERKKSSSPAPLPARRSRRSCKISDNEKTEEENNVDKLEETKAPLKAAPIIEEINEERVERASSEEHAASPSPVRKSRSTRTTPKKRNSTTHQREKSVERKVETIPEEAENGSVTNSGEKSVDIDNKLSAGKKHVGKTAGPSSELRKEPEETERPESPVRPQSEKEEQEEKTFAQVVDTKPNDAEMEDTRGGKSDDDEGAQPNVEEVKEASSLCFTASKDEEHLKTTSDVLDIQTEDVEERNTEGGEQPPKPKSDSTKPVKTDEHKDKDIKKKPLDQPDNKEDKINDNHESVGLQRSVRKRKWLSKKVAERNQPVLAISSDSLKNIISDVVKPVPLSDVQLESSSEEEGLVTSDHDTEDRSVTPEIRVSKDRVLANESDTEQQKPQPKQSDKEKENSGSHSNNKSAAEPAPKTAPVARSPSPARNRASHVLFITNLVRPFTVLQLKGLLARTGKLVEEDGFWIDRIKSKCYVAYTTEDEAIETRHALHGVRWPVSNPKCLNVDFGSRSDMDRAIQSTQNETPKFPQDNTRDNQNAGNTWSRLDVSDKKPVRPVREWDVGKKEPNDRDKSSNDRRRGSKERVESRTRDSERGKVAGDDAERSGQDRKRSRERERGTRDRERGDHHGHGRSRSGSPALKARKKENEPPIRLLDDLFRKTKGTPCIYWLPLTPEAIAEKEAFRQKRIEEHKQRMKEREERLLKEREREKERDRQRDSRRNRSNDRRRSRSRERERRRY